jgi:hypothetical protein
MVARSGGPGEWLLLTYRLPREPSTPRSAVWRRLRRLGVAQLADGLVALPADARTREQLEWVAGEVREAAGSAGVWLARPASVAQERELAAAMAAARAQEYATVRAQADAAAVQPEEERRRAAFRLRAELRRIRRRDFFPPPERDAANAAVEQLAASLADGNASADTPLRGPAPTRGSRR